MSWHSAKKRFQKDIEKLPRVAMESYIKKTQMYTLPTFESSLTPVPSKQRKTKMEDVGIVSGDLVYIAEGPHKGTLSTVYNYSAEIDAVLVANINTKKLLPKFSWVENQTSHLMDYPEPIPLSHVKVAAKDKDENGRVYHVVADQVIYKDKYYDERYKKWIPRRFVKDHETIEIPWPKPPTDPRDDYLSTREDVVFEKTWQFQSIAKPPFPKEVLKQLRNSHSKYKKKVFSEVEARRVNGPEMPLSPEQKIYLAKKAQEPPKRLEKLSPEIQDFIGEKVAAHLNGIESPHMLAHLEALSKVQIPDFEETITKIEESESSQ